jgi:hypothetical protein
MQGGEEVDVNERASWNDDVEMKYEEPEDGVVEMRMA